MQNLEKISPTHFTRRNKIIFVLAIVFSVAALIALFKVQPKDDNQSRKMLATLVDHNQIVTRKYSNSLSFIEIDKGEKLFNGDQIFTGENSTAKVVFTKSGNILNIPSRGLVKIEEGLNGENVDIQKGLAEFIIQKGQSMNIIQGAETITLKSDENSEGVGKIIFKDNKITLQVDSGKISLNDSAGNVQELKKNESASIASAGISKVGGVNLTRPTSRQKIDIWNDLTLEWTTKGAIEAILAKDSGFKEIVGKTTAESSPFNWSLPLQEGQYFLKVSMAGTNATEAKAVALEMFSSKSINSFSPADQAVVNLKRGENLKFSWNELPVASYKVTLKNQEGKVTSYTTDKAEYVLEQVTDSSIDWSVAPQLFSGVVLMDSKTNQVNLSFEGKNTIISPKNNQRFLFEKDKIQIIWSTSKNERTNVKITNTDLNQVVVDKDSMESQMVFTPEAPGVYSVVVTSKDFPNPETVDVKFLVNSKIAQWNLGGPVELSSVDLEAKKVELKFTPINKDLTDYELSIYNDSALRNKIITSKVPSTIINYTVKNFGTYCFVLRSVNKNSSWLPSSSQCIIYKEKAPFEVIAKNKNIILKYTKVNGVGSYIITLPEVPKAIGYEVNVYDRKKKIVFTDRSRNNQILWPSTRSGVFYYNYRVVDSRGRTSAFSGVSKLLFPISPLADWKE